MRANECKTATEYQLSGNKHPPNWDREAVIRYNLCLVKNFYEFTAITAFAACTTQPA
ncbi:hypothetical protein QUA81_19580 [Microcoleus sp. F6_B4]